MKIKNLNNTAFSLLEVLLASIIFVIAITGVFVTLDAIRRPVADKESALTAAVFGKQVLEALRTDVDANSYYSCCSTDPGCTYANSCGDFSLALGPHQVSSATLSLVGLSFPQGSAFSSSVLTYNVTCADGSSYSACGQDTARKVDLMMNWANAT